MAMIQNSENVREEDHRRREKSNIQFHQFDNNNESNDNGVSNGVARNDVFNSFSNAQGGMTTRSNTEIPTTNYQKWIYLLSVIAIRGGRTIPMRCNAIRRN